MIFTSRKRRAARSAQLLPPLRGICIRRRQLLSARLSSPMKLKNRNMILRIVKPYPEARNHVYTGHVVDWDEGFLAIDGCVLSFGRPSTEDPSGGLTVSQREVRWVPRERIQYVRELPEAIDPFNAEQFQITPEGKVTHSESPRPDLLPE